VSGPERIVGTSRPAALDAKAIQANDRISGMEDLIRRTIGPSITLKTVLAPDLWVSFCDRNQLESAILNLCINARDAMTGGGSLLIETANPVHSLADSQRMRDAFLHGHSYTANPIACAAALARRA
jgi:signal transduction histidine kinase